MPIYAHLKFLVSQRCAEYSNEILGQVLNIRQICQVLDNQDTSPMQLTSLRTQVTRCDKWPRESGKAYHLGEKRPSTLGIGFSF